MTPWLVLPLLCGLVFPVVAWLLKRGMETSRDPWGVLIVSSVAAAIPFVVMSVLTGGDGHAGARPETGSAWAGLTERVGPAPPMALACGAFFFVGQIASYLSLAKGDLSVAIPVQGVKILMISLFALAFLGHSPGWTIWAAAVLVPAALYFMREHPPGDRETRRHRVTVMLALAAAAGFAALDTGVQAWGAAGGFQRFGFWTFVFQAALAMGLYFMPGRAARFRYSVRAWGFLLAGSLSMAVITFTIVWVIARTEQAAWVNILFNSRVLWGAALPLAFGRLLAAPEALNRETRRLLPRRLFGAALMLASIVLAVL